MEFGFEKLEVYRLSIDFANKAFALSKNFSVKVQSSLGDQLRRAVVSIANNIAEGSNKVSDREKKQFYSHSLNSTAECIPIMTIANMQHELSDPDHEELREICGRIYKMLFKLIRAVDKESCSDSSVLKPKTINE